MGKIISPSKPKVSTPQVVYVPQVAATPSTPSTDVVTETEKTPEQVSAERAETLLRRNRSRLGTVLTGFRGVLEQNDLAAQRKSLLGE